MSRGERPTDVFISHAAAERAAADSVAAALSAAGFSTYQTGQADAEGRSVTYRLWEAIAESDALVAVLGPSGAAPTVFFEVGAASAWGKPIFLVAAGGFQLDLPAPLLRYPAFPLTRADDVARTIRATLVPLTDNDRSALARLYEEMKVPTDQLVTEGGPLSKLSARFRERTGKPVPGEVLARELMRMRKQGLLPHLRPAV